LKQPQFYSVPLCVKVNDDLHLIEGDLFDSPSMAGFERWCLGGARADSIPRCPLSSGKAAFKSIEGERVVKPRISMITLGVRDLERSVRFYEAGLGLPRMESPPEVAFFTLHGSWLALYGRESLAEDAGIPSEGSGFCGFTIAHNVESEAEVDAVMEQALSAGARLIREAQKVFWGGYSGYFADPDGFLWEIAYNPLFWVGPKNGTA
jgi:uncharacterized protein